MSEQEAKDDGEVQTWQMFASYDEDSGEYRNVSRTERNIQMFGHTAVAVEVTANEVGLHWGWLPLGAEAPRLIQHNQSLYRMQFPYRPESEEAQGRGHTVQLLVTALRPST